MLIELKAFAASKAKMKEKIVVSNLICGSSTSDKIKNGKIIQKIIIENIILKYKVNLLTLFIIIFLNNYLYTPFALYHKFIV